MYLTQTPRAQSSAGAAAVGILNRVASLVTGFFVALYTANRHHRQYEALASMSDEALAARGLKREDLVRKVFAEYLV